MHLFSMWQYIVTLGALEYAIHAHQYNKTCGCVMSWPGVLHNFLAVTLSTQMQLQPSVDAGTLLSHYAAVTSTVMCRLQIGGIDFMAMTLAAAVATSKPLKKMIRSRPAQVVNDTKGRTLLLVVIVFHTITMVIAMTLLSKQSWYQGQTYHDRQVSSIA